VLDEGGAVSEPALARPERCDCGLEWGHDESCGAANELVDLRAENDHLRALLVRSHDVMVTVMNDIVSTYTAIGQGKRRRRLKRSESCVDCGAAAHPRWTRCTPCGRRNSAGTIAARKRASGLCSAGEGRSNG
jgi:hypothetical protein